MNVLVTFMANYKRTPPLFTEEQKNELSYLLAENNTKMLTQAMLSAFLEKHSMTTRSLARKRTASKLDIKFGFSYDEFLIHKNLHSKSNKSNLLIYCSCGKKYYTLIMSFMLRRFREPACDDCYRKTFAYGPEWREANSKAQIIAQNKPEALEKQRIAQKKRYEDPKVIEHYQEIGRNLWENEEYRIKVMSRSAYSKHGIYNGIAYQSALELAFILRCEKNSIKIINWNLPGIAYRFQEKNHKYYPDFIINDNVIVEIKGHGRFYQRFFDRTQEKFRVLKTWGAENNFFTRVIFDTDFTNRDIKQARKFHAILDKQKNDPLQGESP